MFRNSVATSGEWASVPVIQGSTESRPTATTNQSDSSSSRQIDKVDTNLLSYAGDITPSQSNSPNSILPPSPLPSKLGWPAPLIRVSPGDPTFVTQVEVDELPENTLAACSSSDDADDSRLPSLVPVRRPSQSQPIVQARLPPLIVGSSADPIYENQVRVDENKAQSAYPLPDGTVVSRLPPLTSVRHPNQSQPNIQAQSTTISSPVSPNAFTPVSDTAVPANPILPPELPSQYSWQESHGLPTVQPPIYPSRTPGDIPASFREAPGIIYQNLNSNPPQMFPPHQYASPFQQSAPNNPSMYLGTPSQPYGPQSYPLGPNRPFVPQSAAPQFYSLPSAPTPQAQSIPGVPPQFVPQSGPSRFYTQRAPTPPRSIHVGTPPQFAPESGWGFYGPSAPIPQGHAGTTRPFIPDLDDHLPSSQPFSDSRYAVPRPSRHNPVPRLVKPQKFDGYVATNPFQVSHGDDKNDAPSDGLTFDDITTAGPAPGPQFSHGMAYESLPNRPIFGGNPSNTVPLPGTYEVPKPPVQPQTSYPFIPPGWGDDTFGRNHSPILPHLPSAIYIQPKPPTPVSLSPVQSQAPRMPPVISPVFPDSPMPSIRSSPVVGPKSEDNITPFPADPVDRPSSPSYLSGYEEYLYAELPKKSNFSQLTRFFRLSRRTHSLGSRHSSLYPFKVALKLVLETFPKQLYLHFLLRLPSLYFSRVARIFEDADMSLPEIRNMAFETASQGLKHVLESPSVPPAYKRLTSTWEDFIDSVMREWKTFNVVSVLLLTATLTILQINSVAEDPVTRYTALFSLICSLISLLFGCLYIVQFGSSMRKSYKAAEWALEAQKTKTLIWWNVWVLLAMPAIWLIWSIILYLACIVSFVWRSRVGDPTPPSGLSDTGLLVIRIVISVILGIGIVYGFLIINTFRRYGSAMDQAWKERITRWIEEKAIGSPGPFPQPVSRYPSMSYTGYPDGSPMRQPPNDYQPHYQPYFYNTGHPWMTYTPPPVSTVHIPRSRPSDSPYSTSPNDVVTEMNTNLNQSSKFLQDASPGPVSIPGSTPPLLSPKVSIEIEIPPRINSTKPNTGPRSLPPIPGSPTTLLADKLSKDEDGASGFSSGLENRVGGGDNVPDDENRVRFRLPLNSLQGNINVMDRNMNVEVEVSGTSQQSSDNGFDTWEGNPGE